MRRNKINITVQYALSYCVVIVVTALFVFLMVEWILLQHKETLVKNVKEDVHTYMDELDMALAKQKEIAQEIFSDDLTSPDNITTHPLQTVKGIKQLELYRNSLLLNDCIFLKYPGYDELILQSGTISTESFIKYQLKMEETGRDIFLKMLENHSSANSEVLLRSDGESVFVWTYSFRNSFNGKEGIVGFCNYGSTFRTYLENAIRDMPFYAVMVSDDGKVLFEINKLSEISDKKLSNVRELILSGKETSVKGYTMDVFDSVNGFMLCMALEDDYILSDFNKTATTVLFLGGIIFAVAFLLIIFVNSIHVKKIRIIRDRLIGLEETGEVLNANEFSQIQDLIKKLYREQTRRVEEKHSLDVTMSELIGRLLLSGRFAGREDMLQELITMFCPDFQNKYYTVIGIISGERGEELAGEMMKESSYVVCQGEKMGESNLSYLILSMADEDADGKRRRTEAAKLRDKAHILGITKLFFITGRVYHNMYEISESYHEVLLVSNILLSSNEEVMGRTFVFEDVLREKSKEEVLESKRNLFEIALREGSLEDANAAAEALFAYGLHGRETSENNFAVYVLADMLAKIFGEIGCDEVQLNRLKRASFEDSDSFRRFVLKMVAGIKTESTVPIEDILAYINLNYRDNTMGLDTLAARFNMSVSNLSRKIKENIGENWSDYIFRIRVEEACRLLRETDLSVRSIPAEVGYSDYSSFSRKFKAKLGVTLKEYRNKYQVEGDMG